MITLYSGIPGSGKTYKMVSDLVREHEKYFVVHNIDGLRPELLGELGFDFRQYCIERGMEVEEFFSKEYQTQLSETVREKYQKPCLVIIDESHEWFSRVQKTLKMWLSYHRHLGQDIWLVAHKSGNLSSVYRSFIEVEFRAKAGQVLAVPGFFAYNRILGGQRVGYKFERKRQEVFGWYKSQASDKPEQKKKSYVVHAMILIVIAGLALFLWIPTKILAKKGEIKEDKKTTSEQKKAAVKKEQKEVVELQKKLVQQVQEERFIFVGGNENYVVIEDMRTGVQRYINPKAGKFVVVEYERGSHCKIYDVENKMHLVALVGGRSKSVPESSQGAGLQAALNQGLPLPQIAQNKPSH